MLSPMADDTPRRRPGRPPIDPTDPISAQVHLTLPSREFDFYCKRALRRGISIAEVIRNDLRHVQQARAAAVKVPKVEPE
jgi:hypothetical protein